MLSKEELEFGKSPTENPGALYLKTRTGTCN